MQSTYSHMTNVGVVMDDHDSDDETFPLPSNGVEHKETKPNSGRCGRCQVLWLTLCMAIDCASSQGLKFRINMCSDFSVVTERVDCKWIILDATPNTAILLGRNYRNYTLGNYTFLNFLFRHEKGVVL